MRSKKIIGSLAKLPSTAIKVLLVVAAISLILCTKVFAEFLVQQKIVNVPVELFTDTSYQIFLASIGGVLIAISMIFILPVFKTILFLAGVLLMYNSLMKLYRVFLEKKNP